MNKQEKKMVEEMLGHALWTQDQMPFIIGQLEDMLDDPSLSLGRLEVEDLFEALSAANKKIETISTALDTHFFGQESGHEAGQNGQQQPPGAMT